MTRLFIATILSLGFVSGNLNAQASNQEAKALLQEASQKLKAYKSVYIDFTYNFENNRVTPPVTQKEKGSIAMKADDYHLTFMGMEQIRNGNTLYNILKADEEVQITKYEEDDENQGLTPSSILNLYQKDFSYKLGGSETKNGKTIQYVVLKPNGSEEIDKIMVGVEKASKKLVSLKQWGTNGTITTFEITELTPDKNLPANYFTFNKSDYPGYYIAD